jgi:hypothetical protein
VDRVAAQQQFADRIVRESAGVIAIGMATRDGKDARREQVADVVRHACQCARIGDRRGQGGQQPRWLPAVWSRIAPPSELAWGRSNRITNTVETVILLTSRLSPLN